MTQLWLKQGKQKIEKKQKEMENNYAATDLML